jgi:hypothetical protein
MMRTSLEEMDEEVTEEAEEHLVEEEDKANDSVRIEATVKTGINTNQSKQRH